MQPYYEYFFVILTLLIAIIIIYFLLKINILINLSIKYLKRRLRELERDSKS